MRSVGTVVGLGLGLVFVMGACGDGDSGHVELSGKTPSEAAALVARSVCAREARCGRPSIVCESSGAAGGSGSDAGVTTSCTATIRTISVDDCTPDVRDDLAQLLTCAAPSAEQIDVLELCFDALAARPCVTQAEADDWARAAETGTAPPDEELPPSCALLTDPPPSCQTPTRALRAR